MNIIFAQFPWKFNSLKYTGRLQHDHYHGPEFRIPACGLQCLGSSLYWAWKLGKVTVSFWPPTMQQHQWFLPVLPGTEGANVCICETTWTGGFPQACSQQTFCLGQVEALVHRPCCTEAPPLTWITAMQWWNFRIQWKTHWGKEIFACENARFQAARALLWNSLSVFRPLSICGCNNR